MSKIDQLFLENLIRRTAEAAYGQSSLRKQGAAGIIQAARSSASKLDLLHLSQQTSESFLVYLDGVTVDFLEEFPDGAKNWGAARKAVNLFLRDATYNADLNREFKLSAIRPFLEVPLDKDVATGLRAEAEGKELPKWGTIKRLTIEGNAAFQAAASKVAKRQKIDRVDLDVFYWRPKK